MDSKLSDIEAALSYLTHVADESNCEWYKMLCAIFEAGGDRAKEAARAWSATSSKYNARGFERDWGRMKNKNNKVTKEYLFKAAMNQGWVNKRNNNNNNNRCDMGIYTNNKPFKNESDDGENFADYDEMVALFDQSKQANDSPIGRAYLQHRGIPEISYPQAVTVTDYYPYIEKIKYPALIAPIRLKGFDLLGVWGCLVSKNGSKLVWMKDPKRMRRIKPLSGGGVWLREPTGGKLVICEGVENGMVAAHLMPAWGVVSSMTASLMGSLEVPDYVDKVLIVVDPDEAGHTAAAKLKSRLIQGGLPENQITTRVPNGEVDLLDWYLADREKRQKSQA